MTKRIAPLLLGVLLGVLPMLMAPTGGMPSRPRFQKVSIGTAPLANSNFAMAVDSAVPYAGGPAGPMMNLTASRAAIQGFWVQNKSTATNATNYGIEVANDTVGREVYLFNTSTTFVGPWGAGIPSGHTMGLDTPATSGFLTLATNSRNRFGVALASGAISIGNATDNAPVSFLGTGAVDINGVTIPSVYASAASATLSRASVTAVALDTVLFSTLRTGTYQMSAHVQWLTDVTTTQGMRFGFGGGTATVSGNWQCTMSTGASGTATSIYFNLTGSANTVDVDLLSAGALTPMSCTGHVVVTGAGTAGLLWSQNSSSVNNTTRGAGSNLTFVRAT